MLRDIYYRSGDLTRVLSRIPTTLARLRRRNQNLDTEPLARITAETGQVIKILKNSPDEKQIRVATDLLYKISKAAQGFEAHFLPTREELLKVKHDLMARLQAAGYRAVPAYGMEDGSIGIPAEFLGPDLKINEIARAMEQAHGETLFQIRKVEPGDVPRDRDGKVLESPPQLLWLRLSRDENEKKSYRELTQSLRKKLAEYGVKNGKTKDSRSGSKPGDYAVRFGGFGQKALKMSVTGGKGPPRIARRGQSETGR